VYSVLLLFSSTSELVGIEKEKCDSPTPDYAIKEKENGRKKVRD
jgi:hypothetical protein